MLWVGPSALRASPCSALHHGCGAGELRPPGAVLGRGVLREGVVAVSFRVKFGSQFGNDFPWFNCSDNCLFTISIYRAFTEAEQTYALCHCRGGRKVADTSVPIFPFIVRKLFWRNWKGLPASCVALPGTCQLRCLAWIPFSYASALHFQRVLSEHNVNSFFPLVTF